jgi:imidazolonepropionase-like amidohydrolase
MKNRITSAALVLLVLGLWTVSSPTAAQPQTLKALVGGTLIDGFGGKPIRNSVIIIEGERIKAVGEVGVLAVPAGAEIISTEGMSVLPGLWDMHVHLMINGHSDYAHWDKNLSAAAGISDHACLG